MTTAVDSSVLLDVLLDERSLASYRLSFGAAFLAGSVNAVFGFIVTLMGCFYGFNSRGGAQGVGAATTNAVVSSSILILSANLIVTQLFFSN